MQKSSQSVLTAIILACIACLLIAVNILSNSYLKSVRVDLTKQKIFTLSTGSKNILDKVKEPIQLKLYFSKKLAQGNPYLLSFATRVEEFLRQYSRYNDHIALEVIDPEPFTEQEDQAVHYGLQGVPIDNEGQELFFGLVGTNDTTAKEIIPFFQFNRETYLEYDVSKLIYKLVNSEPSKVAVLSGIPIQGQLGYQFMPNASRPWAIWQQMEQHFTMQSLEDGVEQIPSDIKVLMLVNVKKLAEATLYAIDQFVMRGGHIMLFVDPVAEVAKDVISDPLTDLLQSWGVDYDASKVVASRDFAKNVRYMQEGREVVGSYPLWMEIDQKHFAPGDILTANLAKLTFATPGMLKSLVGATTQFAPLVSVPNAMVVPQQDLPRYKDDPHSLLMEYKPNSESITLAARVTGTIYSSFDKSDAEHITKTDNANIVIVADSDMLHEHFWANSQSFLGSDILVPTSGNGTFVLNALDNLSGNSDLIGIRGRNNYIKHFDKIKKLELASQARFDEAEKTLLAKLAETKEKLQVLEQQKANTASSGLVSIEQKQAEEEFRKDLLTTRKELRDVRHALRADIESLEARIKFINIAFIPILLIVFGFICWSCDLSRFLLRRKI